MEIKCEKCGYDGKCPDSFIGKTIKCPKCGHEFVVRDDCAFMVVDEPIAKREPKMTISEVEIGEIGSLKVTNKRLVGEINKKMKFANGQTEIQHVNIDVLLNMITGITVTEDASKKGALPVGCFVLVLGASGVGVAVAVESIFFGVLGALPLLMGITLIMASFFKKIHLTISIAGVDHFIPFETSRKQEAEEKCNLLRKAKAEYERMQNL